MKTIGLAILLFAVSICAVPPEVYSISAVQETDCDGENLVEICFEVDDADGDSIFIELTLYDAGTSVPLHAIYDTISAYPPPNFGWVDPGMHCFIWDMGIDYPGHESNSFQIKIDIFNESTEILTVTDSFPLLDAEGVAWDGYDLRVTRSFYDSPYDTQRVFRVGPVSHTVFSDSCNADDFFDGYTADCEWHDGYLWILGGGLSGQRAKLYKFDPVSCTIVDSSNALWATRWGQGIAWYEGNLYANDSRGKIYRVPPVPPYTPTLWLDLETMHPGLMDGPISADAMVFALGSIWILRNPGPADHILLQFDMTGAVEDSFKLSTTASFGPEGITFDGRCFWYTDHTLDWVYRVCLWSNYDTLVNVAVLDSRDPDVDLYCPTSAVFAGDSLTIDWDVIDLHWDEFEPGSLRVESSVGVHYYPVSGSEINIEVPSVCDSIWIYLAMPDTFCNYGYDSCGIEVCQRFQAGFDCAPCGGISSCADQEVHLWIADSICGESPAEVFFTIKTFDLLGDSTIITRMGPSADVVFIPDGDTTRVILSGIPYVDNDSVWISLDSVFTSDGCITEP